MKEKSCSVVLVPKHFEENIIKYNKTITLILSCTYSSSHYYYYMPGGTKITETEEVF